MTIQINQGRIYRTELRTRMPFRYGIATLTRLPHVFVQLEVSVDGARATGTAADHLPPKWFTKNPDKPPHEEIDEMLAVIRQALAVSEGLGGATVFDVWRQIYDAQASWGKAHALAPLLSNFGTTLVERALLDAFCRARRQPFADVLGANDLGIRLGTIHPILEGNNPGDLLPPRPLRTIVARHTVGLSDPLRDEDIAPDERLNDGLPQSLAACIQTYGLRHFKLKVGGDVDQDVERLRRIADVIEAHAPADYAFSIDGNEQYTSLEVFRRLWESLVAREEMTPFLSHLLFVEQPLHRDLALQPEVATMNRAWPDRPPTIIDESDATLESLPTALELGYAGTSHKNCKGVFKGIANACLLAHRRRARPEQTCLLSGEDLSNVGPIALLQDLAVQASLGITSVERNGHHYFAGLSQFAPEVQAQVLHAHGDLYHSSERGWPTLTIEQGQIALDSVLQAPFGVGFDLSSETFTSVN